jgi:hypothetical protein
VKRGVARLLRLFSTRLARGELIQAYAGRLLDLSIGQAASQVERAILILGLSTRGR